MANGGRIQYTVGFNVDQSGLNSMKTALTELKKMPLKKFVDIGATRQDFDEVKSMAREVESVLKKSFNSELGSINLTKFNSELSKSGLSLQQIQQTFSKAGATGNSAFRSVAAQLANVKVQAKQTNKFVAEMGQTLKNTVQWGVSSAAWNTITNSIQGAFNYAKKLASSLNDIRIVTGKTADEMERFAIQANKAAKNLGQGTTSYTNASLIYYQQGLEDAEVQARTETTLKAANVTGQSAAEVSEQLTAVWNGYKVNAEEAELYIDKLAAVAATTAADLEELSTGMSKVASAANLMGVDMDQLNAQLATIVSVTRQAPESVGTALKTIYARMGDIEAGLDTETTLGNYTEQMAAMGFNVLDANGQLKDMGEVIEEIGGKWTTLNREQQVALSQTMAGTRQYNNLLSLFDNWDMYTEALNTSATAAGTLQEQQDIYMESTAAHLQQLSTAGERVYNSLFDASTINPLIDALTSVVSLLGDLIDGFGGGGNLLLALGSIATRVFKGQIAEGISTTVKNIKNQKENNEQLIASYETMKKAKEELSELDNVEDATQKMIDMAADLSKYRNLGLISEEDQEELLKYINRADELGKQYDNINKKKEKFEKRKTEATSTMEDLGFTSSEKGAGYWLKDIQEQTGDILDSSNKPETLTEEDILQRNTAYQSLTQKIQEQREVLKIANEEAKKSYQALAEAEEQLANAETKKEKNQKQKELQKTQRTFAKDARKLIDDQGDKLTEDTKQNVEDALAAYNEALSSGKGIENAAQAFRRAYLAAIKEVEERLDDLEDSAKDVATGTAQALDQETEDNKTSQQENQQNFNKQLEDIDFEAIVQGFTDLAGAAGEAAAGVQGIWNAFAVWQDEDLSFVEKLTQSVMGLATSLPLAYSGFNTLFTAFDTFKKKIAEKAAAQTAAAAQEQAADTATAATNTAEAATEGLQAAANEQTAASSGQVVAAQTAEQVSDMATAATNSLEAATEGGQGLMNVGNSPILKGGEKLVTGVKSGASKLVTGVKSGASKLATGLKTGLSSGAGAAAGAVVAGVAVVAAATAIAYNAANASYAKAKEEAEELSKASQQLKENYAQVTAETDAMKASFDRYNETKKSIDELTIGTQEWKDAIRDANMEVSDLITKYPELAKYVSNTNGQLTISEEGQAALLEKQKETEKEAYEASQMASIANLEAQSDLEIADVKKKIELLSAEGTAAIVGGTAAAGAIAGAAIGSAVPIIGTVVGGVVGALGGAIAASITEMADVSEEQLEAVAEAYDKYGEDIFEGAGALQYYVKEATGVEVNFAEADLLIKNTNALRELSNSVNANTRAQELQEQQVLSSAFEGNAVFDSSELKDEIVKVLQDDVFEPTGDFYKAAKEEIKSLSEDELMDAYAEKMGFDVDSSEKDDDGNYVFNLSDGTTRTIDQDAIKDVLIRDKSVDLAEDKIAEVEQQLSSLAGIEGVGDTLLGFAGGEGDLMAATGEDLYNLLMYIEDLEADPAELEKVAKNLGYESGEAFLKEYQRAANEQYRAETDLFQDLYSKDKYYEEKGMGDDYLNEMSLEQQKNTIELLNDAERRLGDAGFEYFDTLFQENAEHAEEMSKLFAATDWSSPESIEELKNELSKLGIVIDSSDETWNQFIDSMEKSAIFGITNTIAQLAQLRDTLSQIDSITGDLKIGSIVSDEDYEALLKLNPELEKYFMLTNSGYQFAGTGSGLSLTEILKKDFQEEDIDKLKADAEKVAEIASNIGEVPTSFGPSNADIQKQYLSNYIQTLTEEQKAALNFAKDINTLNAQELQSYFETAQNNDAKSTETIAKITASATAAEKKDYLKSLDKETLDYLGIGGEGAIDKLTNAGVEKVINQLTSAIEGYQSGLYETQKVEELWISNSINNLHQLNQAYLDGKVGIESYAKARKILIQQELVAAGISEESISSYKETMTSVYGMSDAMAEAVTYQSLLGNTGVDTLKSDWQDLWSILQGTENYDLRHIEALETLQTALSQILGVNVTEDFINNNSELIQSFVDGSEEALDAIRANASEEIYFNIINKTDDIELKGDVTTFVEEIQAALGTVEFGDKLPEELQDKFTEMLEETGEFSAEMIQYLSSIGFAFEKIVALQNFKKLWDQGDKSLAIGMYAAEAGLSGTAVNEEGKGRNYSDAYYEDMYERILSGLSVATYVGNPEGTDTSELTGDGDSSKAADPDQMDLLEEERDIYHDINVELKVLSNNLEKVQTEQEKLAGKNLIDNLNQQLVILEQQVSKQREKLAMQKQEQKDMQAALKMQGVEFYDDGTVANYNEALNTHMAAVNAAITYYNSLSAEAQEAYQDQLDNIKEEYEKFKEDLEYYEQLTLDDIHGLEQEISDAISKQIELKIEAFDIKVQIELDYTELQRDWNDFLKDLNLAESDIFGRTESDLRNLDTLLRDIDTRTKAANETTQDFLEGLVGSEDSRFVVDGVFDEAAAREALLNHYNELQDELLNTKQLINDTQRSYLEAMDQAQEKLDKQIESYEFINDLLNHGLKMTELLGGEDAYEEMAKYYEDMANNYEQQADMLRKEKSMWAEEIERAKAALAAEQAKPQEERDAQTEEILQEQLDKAVENWRAATQELNDITASAVENLQAQYENSIDLALQRMADKLTNGKGLDYIAKEWELINDNADRYLDTVNSTYEVQALQSKYMQAINNTDSSYAQKKLNEAMEEELKALREKDKLTQYDIDRANKKYDITLKQIALEEAQQNASSMRLRRDSQGNYSYQFVADEDAVAKAEQDLLAAQNDLYNFDKDAYEKNLDEAYDAYVQFQEDLKEAAMINDPEERAAREALIREQYEQKINDLTAINETIRSNLQESAFDALAGMYDTNEENFKLMNDDVLADFSTLTLEDMPNLMGQLVEGWNTGIQEMITNFADPEEGFSAQCKVAYEDIKTAQDIYEEGLKELGLTAENIFDQIYDDIGEDIEQTKSLMDTNDELISQLRDDLDKQWDLVANQLAILKDRYADLEQAALDALQAMMAVQNMNYNKDTSSGGENSGDTSDPSSDEPGNTDPSQEDDPGSKGKQGKMPSNDVALGVAAAIWRVGNYAGWDNDPVRKAKLTEKFTSDGRDKIQGLLNRVDNGEQNAINRIWSVKDSDLYKYHYDKFDTGGYTGEWGSGGKLAMLHQKEIVLNARDTENLLSAVNIVRGLGDMVQTLSAALASNLTPAAVPVGGNQGADTIEQNVHITAEFPNVSSSSEIEQALRNLTNVASQRAFNTRR